MAARKKMIDILFHIPIPIPLDEYFTIFKYSSYSSGYHAYKEILLWMMIL